MNIKAIHEKYMELCYKRSIHEYKKIDQYKGWFEGQARKTYKRIRHFYTEELGISEEEFKNIEIYYARFDELFIKYYNADREELFRNPGKFLEWYTKQKDSCKYCEITQTELHKIVE